jgi:electron transfer flavoprotein alpha/beta subunit
MTMDPTLDLQAQIIALRMAAEGAWLSLLRMDTNAISEAARLRTENVAAVSQLNASNPQEAALRDAVSRHVDIFWGSIGWQLEQPDQPN